MKLTGAILMLLCAGLPAWGWDFAYSVTVDSQSPRYELPAEDLASYGGGGRNNVRYSVTNFIAPISGLYRFVSVGVAGWDNFLVLYRTAFDPNAPLVNAVVANDNNPTVGVAGFTAVLAGGEQYFVVTSAASNGGGFHQAQNTISNGVPEPSTQLLLAAGLILCWSLRRSALTPRSARPVAAILSAAQFIPVPRKKTTL